MVVEWLLLIIKEHTTTSSYVSFSLTDSCFYTQRVLLKIYFLYIATCAFQEPFFHSTFIHSLLLRSDFFLAVKFRNISCVSLGNKIVGSFQDLKVQIYQTLISPLISFLLDKSHDFCSVQRLSLRFQPLLMLLQFLMPHPLLRTSLEVPWKCFNTTISSDYNVV